LDLGHWPVTLVDREGKEGVIFDWKGRFSSLKNPHFSEEEHEKLTRKA